MSDRRVHFSVPIHQVEYLDRQWETASRLARDGSDWLRMGLDRLRFRDRIERSAELLNEVLSQDHRSHIYQERFENFVIPTSKQETTSSEGIESRSDRCSFEASVSLNYDEGSELSQQQPQHKQCQHLIKPQPNQLQQLNKRRRRRKLNNRRKNRSQGKWA